MAVEITSRNSYFLREVCVKFARSHIIKCYENELEEAIGVQNKNSLAIM